MASTPLAKFLIQDFYDRCRPILDAEKLPAVCSGVDTCPHSHYRYLPAKIRTVGGCLRVYLKRTGWPSTWAFSEINRKFASILARADGAITT